MTSDLIRSLSVLGISRYGVQFTLNFPRYSPIYVRSKYNKWDSTDISRILLLLYSSRSQ